MSIKAITCVRGGEETTEAEVATGEVVTEEEGASTETTTREGSTEGEANRGTRRR